MPTLSLPDLPGLRKQPTEVRVALARIADAHGWSADGMAAQIEHESGWDTTAKNPSNGASGYLQWTRGTAEAFGTSLEQIRAMAPLDQLRLAERYWQAASNGREVGPTDWLVLGLGTGNVGGYRSSLLDSDVLYPAGSPGAVGNPGLQDSAGDITVGTARAAIVRMLSGRGRLPLVAELEGNAGKAVVAAGAAEALVWVGLGLVLLVRLLRRRSRV